MHHNYFHNSIIFKAIVSAVIQLAAADMPQGLHWPDNYRITGLTYKLKGRISLGFDLHPFPPEQVSRFVNDCQQDAVISIN